MLSLICASKSNFSLFSRSGCSLKDTQAGVYGNGCYVSIVFNRLKGKFSSGTEGALASKFNYDFE